MKIASHPKQLAADNADLPGILKKNMKPLLWCCKVDGALGSYQAGVFEALSEVGIQPT